MIPVYPGAITDLEAEPLSSRPVASHERGGYSSTNPNFDPYYESHRPRDEHGYTYDDGYGQGRGNYIEADSWRPRSPSPPRSRSSARYEMDDRRYDGRERERNEPPSDQKGRGSRRERERYEGRSKREKRKEKEKENRGRSRRYQKKLDSSWGYYRRYDGDDDGRDDGYRSVRLA